MFLIASLCNNVTRFLVRNPKHTAAIHCKAGKGRTGLMICCLLLQISARRGNLVTADEAMLFYGDRRTEDRAGVTIP